jgi:hypothetical protein
MFTVYLPAAPVEAREDRSRTLPSVRGSETVLVVDDEQDILQAVQDALSSH